MRIPRLIRPRPAGPSLSAFVRFHRDAQRIAATVEQLRPYVDELVLAADEKVPEADVQALAALAGVRVLRVPWAEPAERANAYLHGQCGGDWILRVDGDEIVAGWFLERLRELVADRRYTHYFLPRAWLWPDRRRMLAERPWWPDLQLRLARNDPALAHFEGEIHTTADVAGPARILEQPALYHVDLLVTSREEREDKAARYEAAAPGQMTFDLPFNTALYVPEHSAAPPTMPLPTDDAGAIDRFLDAPPLEPARAPADIPRATHAEIDALWAPRRLPESAYHAAVEIADPDLRFTALEGRTLFVTVENRGSEVWPGGDRRPGIRLSYRWLRPDGSVAVPEGLRSILPGAVAPGERAAALLSVVAPQAGSYTLEVDLVEDGVRWFEAATRIAVEVSPARTAAGDAPAG